MSNPSLNDRGRWRTWRRLTAGCWEAAKSATGITWPLLRVFVFIANGKC
jgi:hypothetical protein